MSMEFTNPTPDEVRRWKLAYDPVGYVIQQMDFVLSAPAENDDAASHAMREMVTRWRDTLKRAKAHHG